MEFERKKENAAQQGVRKKNKPGLGLSKKIEPVTQIKPVFLDIIYVLKSPIFPDD